MTFISLFGILFLSCICNGAALESDNPKLSMPQGETSPELGSFKSIFSFGDSLTDTGNLDYYNKGRHNCANPPYGETYFRFPTGRCSDGRLVIDFIAQALGLPLIPIYLGHNNTDFEHGVNFAVAGSTAINASFFEEKNIELQTDYSLAVQVGWFKQLLPSLCGSHQSCESMLRNSLFLVGEIGGDDVNEMLWQGANRQDIRKMLPNVTDEISSAITTLINEGAVTLVVPGNLPIGCLPFYLDVFHSSNKEEYDNSTGCLKWFNELAQFQNQLLQNKLSELRLMYPQANIIYVDYYNIATKMITSPEKLGFNTNVLTRCCGVGVPCGLEGSTSCDDPSVYVNWDGVHLTEAAYKTIAANVLQALFTDNRLNLNYAD